MRTGGRGRGQASAALPQTSTLCSFIEWNKKSQNRSHGCSVTAPRPRAWRRVWRGSAPCWGVLCSPGTGTGPCSARLPEVSLWQSGWCSCGLRGGLGGGRPAATSAGSTRPSAGRVTTTSVLAKHCLPKALGPGLGGPHRPLPTVLQQKDVSRGSSRCLYTPSLPGLLSPRDPRDL